MTVRPIIFSAPMVRALLEGRKTQTRRLIRCAEGADFHRQTEGRHYFGFNEPRDNGQCGAQLPCLPYAPGDLLYVRETWHTLQKWDDLKPRHLPDDLDKIDFAADGYPRNPLWAWGKNRPPIFLPRWASRLTLAVEDVRVQRLQDISEADAAAEGVEPPSTERDVHDWSICPACGGTGLHGALGHNLGVMEVDCAACDTHLKRYKHLWNSLHGDGAWDANPYVVALTFRVIHGNVDRVQS